MLMDGSTTMESVTVLSGSARAAANGLNTTPGLRGKSISKIAQPVTAPRPRDDLAKSRITVQPGGYVKVPGKEKCATGVADFAGFASVANRLIFPGRS